jgi:tRNA1Val (adenine37-N6)-methyltransferase
MRISINHLMANNYFNFKQFSINQSGNVFRVGTDGVLLGAWVDTAEVSSVLDIGTGTGLLALMMAQRIPDACITAIEPDQESFLCATENIRRSAWSATIDLRNWSLSEYRQENPARFDLIITNPPFFASSLQNRDQQKANFRHSSSLPHEEIISFAAEYLSDNGRLSLILPYAEGNVFIAGAAIAGLFCSRMTRVRALPGSPVNRLLLGFSRKSGSSPVKILTTGHPAHGGYTSDYKELTKEFYLDSP